MIDTASRRSNERIDVENDVKNRHVNGFMSNASTCKCGGVENWAFFRH